MTSVSSSFECTLSCTVLSQIKLRKLSINLDPIWKFITPYTIHSKATQTKTSTQIYGKSQNHTAAVLGDQVYWHVTSCSWVRSSQCVISGFRRDVHDIWALHGCYAAHSASSVAVLSVRHSAYSGSRSHLGLHDILRWRRHDVSQRPLSLPQRHGVTI